MVMYFSLWNSINHINVAKLVGRIPGYPFSWSQGCRPRQRTTPRTTQLSSLLGVLDCGAASQFVPGFYDLDIFYKSRQLFCRMIFSLGLYGVPSWSDPDLEFLANFTELMQDSSQCVLSMVSAWPHTERATFYLLINMLSSREILWDDVKPHFSSLFRPLVLLSIDFSCLNDYSDACQMVIFLIPSSHLHLLVGFRICKGDFFSPFSFIYSFIPSFIYLYQCRFRFLF